MSQTITIPNCSQSTFEVILKGLKRKLLKLIVAVNVAQQRRATRLILNHLAITYPKVEPTVALQLIREGRVDEISR